MEGLNALHIIKIKIKLNPPVFVHPSPKVYVFKAALNIKVFRLQTKIISKQ